MPRTRALSLLVALCALSEACVSMQTTQHREILATSKHTVERPVGKRDGASGKAFFAQVEGSKMLLSFGMAETNCVVEEMLRERLAIIEETRPETPSWRIGGARFTTAVVLGSVAVPLGGVALYSGLEGLIGARSNAMAVSGGILIAGGLAALAQVAVIAIRTDATQKSIVEEDRPVNSFEKTCAALQLASTAFRLRDENDRGFVVATDKSGQVRIDLRHAEVVGLHAGRFVVESPDTGRTIGALMIPPFAAPSPRCGGRPVLRVHVGEIRMAPQIQLDSSAITASATALLGGLAAKACYALVDSEADALLVGAVSATDGLFAVDVSLMNPRTRAALPGAALSTVSAPDQRSLVQTMVRIIDELVERAGR
jgi:hypothetical protein